MLVPSSTPANVTPFPAAVPGPDPCSPTGGPSQVITPGSTQLGTDQILVKSGTTPTRLAGVQPNARGRVVTNQGDGLVPPGGSSIFVTGPHQASSALSSGVRIPPGGGRVFGYAGELWAVSDPTGVPANGNLVDVQTEYDG